MKIYIIRHAQSVGNKMGIDESQKLDFGLSAEGISQAKKLAKRFKGKKIEVIYSSDLKRAYETALRISKITKLKIIKDHRLRELDSGDLNLKNVKNEFRKLYKKEQEKGINEDDVRPKNRESINDAKRRAKSFLDMIISKHNGNIIIVSHGAFIKLLISILYGISMNEARKMSQLNTCLNEIEYNRRENKWKINKIGCVKHIKNLKEWKVSLVFC